MVSLNSMFYLLKGTKFLKVATQPTAPILGSYKEKGEPRNVEVATKKAHDIAGSVNPTPLKP